MRDSIELQIVNEHIKLFFKNKYDITDLDIVDINTMFYVKQELKKIIHYSFTEKIEINYDEYYNIIFNNLEFQDIIKIDKQ